MKLFGVLLTTLVMMGALVGGVVGVLLPKISTGISLGVLSSLYLGVVRLCISFEKYIKAFASYYLTRH